jgi:hypothetical protein
MTPHLPMFVLRMTGRQDRQAALPRPTLDEAHTLDEAALRLVVGGAREPRPHMEPKISNM